MKIEKLKKNFVKIDNLNGNQDMFLFSAPKSINTLQNSSIQGDSGLHREMGSNQFMLSS